MTILVRKHIMQQPRQGVDGLSQNPMQTLITGTVAPGLSRRIPHFTSELALLTRNQILVRAISEARSQMERIMLAAINIHYFGELPGREYPAILAAVKCFD
jgi:hypothetical protein